MYPGVWTTGTMGKDIERPNKSTSGPDLKLTSS